MPFKPLKIIWSSSTKSQEVEIFLNACACTCVCVIVLFPGGLYSPLYFINYLEERRNGSSWLLRRETDRWNDPEASSNSIVSDSPMVNVKTVSAMILD